MPSDDRLTVPSSDNAARTCETALIGFPLKRVASVLVSIGSVASWSRTALIWACRVLGQVSFDRGTGSGRGRRDTLVSDLSVAVLSWVADSSGAW